MGRGKSAAGVRAVHDVVVDQCACLEELQAARGLEDSGIKRVVACVTAPSPVAEGGAEALATGEQSVERVGQWREVLPERGEQCSLLAQHAVDDHLDAGAEVRDVQGVDGCRLVHAVSLRGRARGLQALRRAVG